MVEEVVEIGTQKENVGRIRASSSNAWLKDHPDARTCFAAKLDGGPDVSVNLMVCRCIIPGKAETDWEGGYHPLTLHFSGDYPSKPPMCKISSRVLPS